MTTRARAVEAALALVGSAIALSVAACAPQFSQCQGTQCAAHEAGGAPGAPDDSAGDGGDATTGGSGALSGVSGGGGTDSGATGEGASGGASASGGSAGDGGEAAEGGASGQGSVTGGDGGTPGETSCDPSLTPSEAACVIDEAHGVFVAPDGNDEAGDGSRAHPYATIARAVTAALSHGKRVYACANGGPYAESVSIVSASALQMFGGFSCSDWTYDTNAKSEIASPSPIALRIDEVTSLRIEDFHFQAADAVLAGDSSIGAFITNSTQVVLQRTLLAAGYGMSGSNGTLTAFAYASAESLDGNDETADEPGTGGEAKVCACQTLTSTGGAGGPPDASGLPGEMGLPDYGAGAGGTPPECSTGRGSNGAPAPPGPPSPGANRLGVVTSAGWEPAAGSDGATGKPGQGGGGGASLARSPADPRGEPLFHGGGGGCGGCGGNGGKKGTGGGASIAMLVIDSSVDLDSSSLSAGNGGNGGSGHEGQLGQGEDGTRTGSGGTSIRRSCAGGAGGAGAKGGAGGGGAGGISVGILWSGATTPLVLATSITVGDAGSGGLGGEPSVNDGVDGVAEEVLLAP